VLPLFQEVQPEFVFHLAAQPLVRFSYDDPKLTFDTNVGGSVNILEAVRATPSIRALIYVTSDKCYRNKEWLWGYRENDELGGRDPYSASKAAAELVFSSYQDSFFSKRSGFGAASVRAGNVIGGGDWAADRIVPDCIRSLQNNEPIVLRNPGATRPWQHVLDPLSGYLQAAIALYHDPAGFSGAWNFGPDDSSIRSVKDLAEKIIVSWGEGRIEVSPQQNAPHEATLLHLNCDKSRQLLGWRPCWDVDRAVAETVRWYREVVAGRPVLDISRQQIKDFTGGVS
jgi:CDP-glucose 4,6-dehydratase